MKRPYTERDYEIFRRARARYGKPPATVEAPNAEALDLELHARERMVSRAATTPVYLIPEGTRERAEREYDLFWRAQERDLGIHDDRVEDRMRRCNDAVEELVTREERLADDEVVSLWEGAI